MKQRRRARRRGLPRRRPLRRADRARSSRTSRRRFRSPREPMAEALRALIKFYQTGETADRVAYDIAWVAGQGLAGRHDQRLHRGLHGPARHQGRRGKRWSSTSTRRRPQRSSKLAANAQWFEDRMPWDAAVPQAGRPAASPPTPSTSSIETGDSGPITPVGINLPNDQDDPRAATAASRCRCRTSTRPTTSRRRRSSAASSRGRRKKPSAREKWSSVAGELTTEHARGDRPRARARSPSG